jgi:hypothetical protein
VHKTGEFDLPVRRARGGAYKIPPGDWVWTCFTSDFLLEDADPWRPEAWRMMRERSDCSFFFITKRILRFMECVPPDWGAGYENVHICCTMENQSAAETSALPVLRDIPAPEQEHRLRTLHLRHRFSRPAWPMGKAYHCVARIGRRRPGPAI